MKSNNFNQINLFIIDSNGLKSLHVNTSNYSTELNKNVIELNDDRCRPENIQSTATNKTYANA